MQVTRQDLDGVVILRLAGRLIGEEEPGNVTHDAFREVIDEGHRQILLDLSEVPFVNSTGLGVLVVNYVRLRREQGDLKILNPSGRLRALFRTLPKLFEIYYDEGEALASFS